MMMTSTPRSTPAADSAESVVMRFRGRDITQAHVESIRELIAANPGVCRKRLSVLLCEVWNWRQPNGVLRAMVCRELMLKLHRSGLIELPSTRHANFNPRKRRPRILTPGETVDFDVDARPMECSLRDLGALSIESVRRTPHEALVNHLIAAHHYLGYARPVGEHIKYLVRAQERPVAVMIFCSAAFKLNLRDRWIGWDPDTRVRNLCLIANQTRYLIMPWVRVPHLASHLLGRIARRISRDWQQVYNHPLHYIETFTNPERYAGTCYRAANWKPLGMTSGMGTKSTTSKPTCAAKMLWAYPLGRRWRENLCSSQEAQSSR